VVLVGFFVAPPLAYAALRLMVSAWSACGDAEPPYLFGLLLFDLPLLSLMGLGIFVLIAWLIRRSPMLMRVLLGTVAVGALCIVAITGRVPMNEPSSYANWDAEMRASFPACGRDGVPTWWPIWLPHR
jgi:hypothetical protein